MQIKLKKTSKSSALRKNGQSNRIKYPLYPTRRDAPLARLPQLITNNLLPTSRDAPLARLRLLPEGARYERLKK